MKQKLALDFKMMIGALINDGATLSDCHAAFAERRSRYELAACAVARKSEAIRRPCPDDDLELDDNPLCSVFNPPRGAFVMTWMWVDDEAIREQLEREECENAVDDVSRSYGPRR